LFRLADVRVGDRLEAEDGGFRLDRSLTKSSESAHNQGRKQR
jgi:hypothetical protein